jgi:hypothetical protein
MSNAASAGEVNVGKRELIAPLLPSAPGRTACFRGVFKPVTVDTERYGTGTGQNEPVPYIYTTYRLDALTLQLEYTCTPPRPSSNDDPGYDRRYAFLLSARFAGQSRSSRPAIATGTTAISNSTTRAARITCRATPRPCIAASSATAD